MVADSQNLAKIVAVARCVNKKSRAPQSTRLLLGGSKST